MTEFKVPELGENIATGDVTKVLVNVGDTITREQPVLELETDKATIEVPSSVAGTVKEIKVKPGDKVKTGQVVLVVDNGGAPAAERLRKPRRRTPLHRSTRLPSPRPRLHLLPHNLHPHRSRHGWCQCRRARLPNQVQRRLLLRQREQMVARHPHRQR